MTVLAHPDTTPGTPTSSDAPASPAARFAAFLAVTAHLPDRSIAAIGVVQRPVSLTFGTLRGLAADLRRQALDEALDAAISELGRSVDPLTADLASLDAVRRAQDVLRGMRDGGLS